MQPTLGGKIVRFSGRTDRRAQKVLSDRAPSGEHALLYLPAPNLDSWIVSLTHARASLSSLLMGPVGVALGSYVWWQVAKIDCSTTYYTSECVTTAQGTAYSWVNLASQNVSLVFGVVLAGATLLVLEILIWLGGGGGEPRAE